MDPVVRVEIRTLGGFSWSFDGRLLGALGSKARALLIELARSPGAAVARERLIDVLWPDADPALARGNLKTALWSIRKALREGGIPENAIVSDRRSLTWTHALSLDIADLAQRAAMSGDFLPDDYSDWANAIREHVQAERERLLNAALDEHPNAQDARALLAIDPASERAYATVIAADLEAGRHAAARALLDRAIDAVRDVDPAGAQRLRERFSTLARAAEPQASALPFVGRVRELETLTGLARDRTPPGNIALVCATAGMGKTALLDRFAARVDAAGLRVMFKRGRRYASGLASWHNVIADLSPLTLDEILTRDGARAEETIAGLISGAIANGTILIVDDLHETQGDGLAMFFAVADRVRSGGGLLVGAFRPEASTEVLARLADARPVLITLDALDEDESRSALIGLAGTDGASGDAFYARTKGYPMLMQAFAQRAASGDGLARAIADAALPKDIQGMLVARLSGQSKTAKDVALALALEGSLSLEELAAVAHHDPEPILDAVDELMRIGVLRDAPGGLRPEFTHDLFAEVAVASTSAMRRNQLRRSIAGAIGARLPARAGTHWLEAGESLRAAHAFADAARASQDRFAFRDALLHFEAAIEALGRDDVGRRIDWTCEAASLASRVGTIEESKRLAERAVIEARTFGASPLSLAQALHALTRFGDLKLDDDIRNGLEAADLAAQAEDFELAANSAKSATRGYSFSGRYDEAVATGRLAIAHAERGADAHTVFYCRLELMDVHLNSCYLDAAFAVENEATESARRMGPRYEAELMYRHADGLSHADRFEESIELFERAAAVALSAPPTYKAFAFDSRSTAWHANWLKAEVQAAAGHYAASLVTADALAADPVVAEDPLRLMWARIARMRALAGLGSPAQRAEARAIAESLAGEPLRPQSRAFVDVERAALAAHEDEAASGQLLDAALASLRTMMRIAPRGWDRRYRDLSRAGRRAGLEPWALRCREEGSTFFKRRRERAAEHFLDRPAPIRAVSLP
jgi:DNA-binding SARP family transcriptional activator